MRLRGTFWTRPFCPRAQWKEMDVTALEASQTHVGQAGTTPDWLWGTESRTEGPAAEAASPRVTTTASPFPVSQSTPPAWSAVASHDLPQTTPFLLLSCLWTCENEQQPSQKLRSGLSGVSCTRQLRSPWRASRANKSCGSKPKKPKLKLPNPSK